MHPYVEVKILNPEIYPNEDALPRYATPGSAGIDLLATCDMLIKPGQKLRMPTGLAIWLGAGSGEDTMVALMLPRSGLGNKGLVLANTVGVIDSDYQGEWIAGLKNDNEEGGESIAIRKGERFAQVLFMPVHQVHLRCVAEFSNSTQRGVGGFGSTGT